MQSESITDACKVNRNRPTLAADFAQAVGAHLRAKREKQLGPKGESVYLPPRDPDALLVRDGDLRVMPSVAVFPGIPENFRGVYGPGHAKGGSNFLLAPGEPGNERKPEAVARVMSLLDAHTAYHESDAHQVAGVLSWPDRTDLDTYRVNKHHGGHDFIKSLGARLGFSVLAFDWDNPGHERNNDERCAEWKAKMAEHAGHPTLDGFGWALARSGAHMVFVTDEVITDPEEYERTLVCQMMRLLEVGIAIGGRRLEPDRYCKDWTRFLRLNRVIRDGAWFCSPLIDFSRLRARRFDPGHPTVTVKCGKVSAPRSPVPYKEDASIPAHIERLLPDFTPSDDPGTGRHPVMMAVGGALLGRDVAPEIVPALVRAIALKLGYGIEHAERDFKSAKEDTLEKYRLHEPCTGMATLKRIAPLVAAKVNVLAADYKAVKLAEMWKPEQLPTADEAGGKARGALRAAMSSQHLNAIGGPPGVGKTEEEITVLLENLAGAYPAGATKKVDIERAKRGVLATPYQKTAEEVQLRAHKRGLPMLRGTSPQSERNADGTFVCKYHPQVVAMAVGRISAMWYFCNGGGDNSLACDIRDTCVAAKGAIALDADGNKYAVDIAAPGLAKSNPVWVSTHHGLGRVLDKLGGSAKLICDEIAARVDSMTITMGDIDTAIRQLKLFHAPWARAMAPALYALKSYLLTGPLVTTDPKLADAMRSPVPLHILADAPDPDPTLSARMAPFPKNAKGEEDPRHAPPIDKAHIASAREAHNHGQAVRIGVAARVLGFVWRALQDDDRKVSVRIMERKVRGQKVREYIAIEPSKIMDLIVDHAGPRVILSADAVEQAPEVQALVAGTIVVVPIDACDGAPIQRRIITHPAACKSQASHDGQFTVRGNHLALLDLGWKWSAECPQFDKLLVVTWLALDAALRHALAKTDDERRQTAEEWRRAEQTADIADVAAAIKAGMAKHPHLAKLAALDGLHYGATKGIDRFRNHNAILMVGDPIPNVDAMNAEADHLGIDGEGLPESRASCELGQAYGRIRGPRRSAPARACLIGRGSVLPAGWEKLSPKYEQVSGDSTLAEVEAGALGAEHGAKGAKHGTLGAVHGIKGGRPKNDNAMTLAEFAAARAKIGSIAKLAKVTGKSESTLRDYAAGRAGIPASVANDIRAAVGS